MKQRYLYCCVILAFFSSFSYLFAQHHHGEQRAEAMDSLRQNLLSQADFDSRFSQKNKGKSQNFGQKTQAQRTTLVEKKAQNPYKPTENQAKFIEDCENGIDDDGDGFVDCYDGDCACYTGEDCSVETLPSDFKTRLAWRSPINQVSVTATPMVANLNPLMDDMPEIIVPEGSRGQADGGGLLFFKGDGSNKNNPNLLIIPGGIEGYPSSNYAIGDMNHDGVVEVVVLDDNRRLHIYTDYKDVQSNPMTLWLSATQNTDGGDSRPNLADFNGDGIAEIYSGTQIFKIVTTNPTNPILSRVLDGPLPTGQSWYNQYGEDSYNTTAVDLLTPADCNGDPDCNGLELAAGNVIYSIDVDPNDGDGYEIKVQKNLNLMTTGATFRDGYTAVADVDLDGVLDLVVTGGRGNQGGLYIWNHLGLIGYYPYLDDNRTSGSLACIANIYDDTADGYAEDYPEILVCNSYNLNCFNLNKATTTPNNGYWWTLETNDFSGWTGSTFYDFNGDGFSEIVYRDEDHIRILYGGASPYPADVDAERNWFKLPCGSITSDEYPIVADVDNDGEAEIAVTGYTFSGYNSPASDYRGRLNIFESDAEPWLPCRPIWNQFNYFIVNVEDDLSIPTHQQLHHLEFPTAGTSNRPFNKYLAQRQRLNEDFEPFIPVADATGNVNNIECLGMDTILISLEICNTGSSRIRADMPITFYDANPSVSAAGIYDQTHFLNTELPRDSCIVLEIALPRPPNGVTIYGLVNDDGSLPTPFDWAMDFPNTDQPECEFENNIFQFDFSSIAPPLAVSPDTATCPGEMALLSVQSTHETYVWSDGSTGTEFLATEPGVYWVKVEDVCAVEQIDTIYVIEKILDPITLPAVEICPNETVNINIDSMFQQVNWSLNGNVLCANCLAFDFSPSSSLSIDISAQQRGCPVLGTVEIIIHPLPDLALSAIDGACDGTSAQAIVSVLNPANPITYLWSSGANTATSVEAQSGSVTVTVTDGNGCISTGSVTVDVGTALAVAADFDLLKCQGDFTTIDLNMLSGTPPLSYNWANGASTASLPSVGAGQYQVTVTDAEDCKKIIEVDLIEPPVLEADMTSIPILCFGENTAEISVSASGGTGTISYLWSDGFTAPVHKNLSIGNYQITVSDANGCSKILEKIIDQPTELQTLDAILWPACPNLANGQLTFAGAEQGTPPYSYLWSTGDTTLILENLNAGDYIVWASDANGCQTQRIFTLEAIEKPELEAQIIPIKCFGEQTASIELNQLSGANDAAFVWSNGIFNQNNLQLGAGNYSVSVTYGNGNCSFEENYMITEPPLLAAQTNASDLLCFGNTDAQINANPNGGSPPYQFLWSNGSTTPFLDNLAVGAYSLTLTDANACSFTTDVTLSQPTALLALDISAEPTCPDIQNGQVQFLGVTQGTAPYSFVWSNNETDLVLENVAAGVYSVIATDANGCTVERNITVEAIEKPVLEQNQGDIDCFGAENGFISLNQLSGATDANYLWSNGIQGVENLQLAAGSYQVSVSYGMGKCAFTENYTLTEPPILAFSASANPALCAGATDGNVSTVATGGTPPYTYFWSNGSMEDRLTNVSAASYSATLSDAKGCTQESFATVTEPLPILVLDAATTPTCPNTTNGTLTFEGASQGSGALSYLWNTGSTDVFLENLSFGSYTVTVTDAANCTAERSFEVPILDAILLDTVVQQISCFGAADGQILVNQTGGAADAVFVWQNGATDLNLSNLSPGNFFLEASYGNGTCVQNWPFSITEPPLLGLESPVVSHLACFGEATGSIETTAFGGTLPYTWAWSNAQQNAALENLNAGLYQLTLSDANGCTTALEAELTEPPILTASTRFAADTCEANTGMVSVESLGGFGAHTILWSSGETATVLENLSPQNFTVTITDANGCTTTKQVEVPQYGTVPTVEATAEKITCDHPIAEIEATADQNGLTYAWQGADPNLSLNNSFSTVYGGNYNLEVINVFGCRAETTVFVEVDTVQPILDLGANEVRIPCGGDSAQIQILALSTGPAFSHYWTFPVPNNQSQTALNITAFNGGLYQCTVKNLENGCEKTETVLVEKPTPLAANAQSSNVRCFGEANGTAQLTVQSGGIQPYRYAVDGGAWSSSPVFTNLTAGEHHFIIEDDGDCHWETELYISQPDSFWVDLLASDTFIFIHQKVDLTALYGPENSILVDVDWTPNYGSFTPFALQQVDVPITDTEYSIRLMDQNGCIATDRVYVEVENINIWAPNVIDPQDGENRAFTLYTGEDITEIKTLRIYDRWGMQVFENQNFKPNDITLGWDGSFAGQEENPAVFVWYAEVELADGRAFLVKGDVLVLR